MNAILQIWEESHSENILPDGASLHIDEKNLKSFINSVYNNRSGEAPESYSRVVGDSSAVEISETIYNILLQKKTIKLEEYEFNNLVNLNEIKNVE
jgi:hypothetical protein